MSEESKASGSGLFDKASDFLGGLKDKAGNAVEGLVDKAEDLIGEERIAKTKEILNTDVGDIAEDLADKAGDSFNSLKQQTQSLVEKAKGDKDPE